jgi:NADH dehydrogenase
MKVVILGAGFGGLTLARKLSNEPVEVTLVDRNNYHLFTPLLYQVASSLLNPSDIAQPLRLILRGAKNVRFVLGEAKAVDFDKKTVKLADGAELSYDKVVIATGSRTNFFGIQGLEEASHGLKDLPEAVELRNHILRCLEAAARGGGESWLTFVIVGGGPTGVEYAGALSELVHLVLAKEFPELDLRRLRIVLVEGEDRLLPPFDPELSKRAEVDLRAKGVELHLGKHVKGVEDGMVALTDGSKYPAKTVVWCAGVQPSGLAAAIDAPKTKRGRLEVDERLRLRGREDAYAIGDVAGFVQDGRELALMAPQAMQEARYIAKSILGRESGPFRYWDKGSMATIGRNEAVAQVGPIKLKGFIGWIAWLALHLYYIIGFRYRLMVLARWAYSYFFYDRPVRIILRPEDKDND